MLMRSGAVRLLQVSDCHCFAHDDVRLMWTDMLIYPNRSLQAVLDYVKTQTSDYQALLVTGDLAEQEIPETYQRVCDILNTFALPTYAIPGNHDIPEMMQPNLNGYVQMQDEVVINNWHLLLLDTYTEGQPGGSLTEAQMERFEALLNALPEDHFAAVFMHHHPVPINSEWMDVQGLYQNTYFWQLIEHFPQVKVVFNGHIHQEFTGCHEYMDGRQVLVYGTPATCVQLKPVRKTIEFDHTLPAWRDITLNDDGTVITAVHYLPAEIRDQLLY